jgi:hypothetical protein
MRRRDFMGYMDRWFINATKVASPEEKKIYGAATLVAEMRTQSHSNATKVASPEEAIPIGAATSVAENKGSAHA